MHVGGGVDPVDGVDEDRVDDHDCSRAPVHEAQGPGQEAHQETRLHRTGGDGHLGVQVLHIVDERCPFQAGDDQTDDTQRRGW